MPDVELRPDLGDGRARDLKPSEHLGPWRRLPLPEEAYLIAHDNGGKPLLPDRVLGMFLAAAQLAELCVANLIVIEETDVVPQPRRAERHALASRLRDLVMDMRYQDVEPPLGSDALGAYIALHSFGTASMTSQQALTFIDAEGTAPVGDYLSYLGQSATATVRQWLVSKGFLEARASYNPLARGPRVQPARIDVVVQIHNQTIAAVNQGGLLDPHNAILLGLIASSGLDAVIPELWLPMTAERDVLNKRVREALTPALKRLLKSLHGAVTSAVASQNL